MKKTFRVNPLLTLFACLALGASLPAQEAEDEPLLSERVMAENDMMKELERLFHEVETKLIEIDVRLADAGAGETSLEGFEGAGIEKLLRDSQEKSQQVMEGIEKILQVAEQMNQQQQQQQSGGGGGGQPQPGGESPLDQPRDQGPQQRENTPEGPQPGEQDGEGPKPEEKPGEKPGGEEQGQGEKPDSPGKSDERGQNKDGRPDGRESGPSTPRGEDANRWGELPTRVQETFRNQGKDDLPLQYRDWIDSYYRRLNRTR